MKKIKNKFIISVFVIIILIICIGVVKPLLMNMEDKKTFALLVEGNALVNSIPLIPDMRKELSIGDTIRTLGSNSLVVVEWGDGSITRLGGDTTIHIEETYVSHDKSKINLSFELLQGKSWSNVISYLGYESYFNQHFNDHEAGVRGTVFNVDLENEYIYVLDHALNLTTSSGDTILIEAKQPFSLESFTFIDFQKFITQVKDKAWEDINTKFDLEYLKTLKKNIKTNLGDDTLMENYLKYAKNDFIDKLSVNEKKEIFNKLLIDYQQLNIVSSADEELFETKLQIKEILLKLAPESEKEGMIQSLTYDIKEIIADNKLFLLEDFTIDMSQFSIPSVDFTELQNLHQKATDAIQDGLDGLLPNKN